LGFEVLNPTPIAFFDKNLPYHCRSQVKLLSTISMPIGQAWASRMILTAGMMNKGAVAGNTACHTLLAKVCNAKSPPLAL